MLRAAGCPVDDGNRVRIPAALVEDCLATVPSRIILHRRDGEPALHLEDRNIYFDTGSDLMYLIDLETGERRPARLRDVEEMARVADALPNIDLIMSMALASDLPAAVVDRYAYRAMVTHTAKPIVYTTWDRAGARDIIAMAEAVAGGAEALARAPTLLAYLEPSSPLRHSEAALQKLLFLAGKGLPFVYAPGAVAGASAPATVAGGLAVRDRSAHRPRAGPTPAARLALPLGLLLRTARHAHHGERLCLPGGYAAQCGDGAVGPQAIAPARVGLRRLQRLQAPRHTGRGRRGPVGGRRGPGRRQPGPRLRLSRVGADRLL